MKLSEIIRWAEQGVVEEGSCFMIEDRTILGHPELVLNGKMLANEDGKPFVIENGFLDANWIYVGKVDIQDKPIWKTKSVKITNHIGEFKEEYSDSIIKVVLYSGKMIDVVPIDGKIGVAEVDNGTVYVYYTQLHKDCRTYRY